MPTLYWVGRAGDGDWSDANNWSTSRNGAGGNGPPATNDDVFIENLDRPINAGLSQAGVDLASLDISTLPGGSIGSPGSPLNVAVSGTGTLSKDGQFYYRGHGNVWFSAGTANVDQLQFFGGRFYQSGGTITDARIGPGYFEVGSSGTITNAYNYGATLIIRDGSGTVTGIASYAGTTDVSNRALDALTVHGGKLLYRGTTAVVTCNVSRGGILYYASSGTITTLNVYGGVVDSSKAQYPFTVTAATILAGSSYFKNSPVVVTTSAKTLYGYQE